MSKYYCVTFVLLCFALLKGAQQDVFPFSRADQHHPLARMDFGRNFALTGPVPAHEQDFPIDPGGAHTNVWECFFREDDAVGRCGLWALVEGDLFGDSGGRDLPDSGEGNTGDLLQGGGDGDANDQDISDPCEVINTGSPAQNDGCGDANDQDISDCSDEMSVDGAYGQGEAVSDNAKLFELKSGSGKKIEAPLGVQAKKLQELLKKKVCFQDVKDTIYRGNHINVFQADLLQLLRNNVDVRVEEDGFKSYGTLPAETHRSKSVAEAMFELARDKCLTLFQLKFALYRIGYREYSRAFLDGLEQAFVVSGVHPRDRKMPAQSQATLKEGWEKVKNGSLENFQAYLRESGKKKFQKQVLQRLWDMQQSKCLEHLAKLKSALSGQHHTATQKKSAPVRENRKDQVLSFLRAHKNEQKTSIEILRALSLPKEYTRGPGSLLRVVLSLALDGLPIVYDKDFHEVTLLDEKQCAVQPVEGRNLLTMLYDLIEKYGKKLLREEIAYYAQSGGYWPQGFTRSDSRKEFFRCINDYKELLAIFGHISPSCCQKARQDVVKRREKLWSLIQGGLSPEDALLRCCKDFFPKTTQDDLQGVVALKKRRTLADVRLFEQYVVARKDCAPVMTGEEFIETCLIKRDCTRMELLSLCQNRGMDTCDLWAVAARLTCRKEGGRLIYHPETQRFYWSYDNTFSRREDCDKVAAIFDLKCDYPDMPNIVINHMLTQQGFAIGHIHELQYALRGMEVLGLYYSSFTTDDRLFSRHRRLVNNMLSGVPLVPERSATGFSWTWQVAQKVCAWLDDGTMKALWLAYVKRSANDVLQDGACVLGVSTTSKHLRPQKRSRFVRQIIAHEIPQLYHWLCVKNLWSEGMSAMQVAEHL